jgi:hypothetical protein
MGIPAWPDKSWSRDCVPVDVVNRPSNGDGLVPGARDFSCRGMGEEAPGAPMTTLRFRNDMLSFSRFWEYLKKKEEILKMLELAQ